MAGAAVRLREARRQRGGRQRGDRRGGPHHRARVALARERRREQRLAGAQPGIRGGARDLVERQLARPFDLGRIEVRASRARRRARRGPARRTARRRRRDRRSRRGRSRRPALPWTASISRTPPPGAAPLAAAQDEVLEEVRRARQRRRIVSRARRHPDLDRDQRRDVVLLDDDLDTVVEPSPRRGRARRPSPARPRRRRRRGGRLPRVVPQPAAKRRGGEREREPRGTGGRAAGRSPNRRSLPEGIEDVVSEGGLRGVLCAPSMKRRAFLRGLGAAGGLAFAPALGAAAPGGARPRSGSPARRARSRSSPRLGDAAAARTPGTSST